MLTVRNLSVRIGPHQVVAIDELSLGAGERLGLVGESGSGKTMTAMSIVGLQTRDARLSGSIVFEGRELIGLAETQLARIRGARIGVVFQDPLKALNPTMRVGSQIAEALRLHSSLGRGERRARVLELMTQVQLPEPDQLARRYPHELSGGQQQRVLIASAIACRPRLLIADEPTTALDVTVQKEVLDLVVRLSEEQDMALLFVSHNLGVVRAVSDRIAVMYGGKLVEVGPGQSVIDSPRHRYTEALVAANPGALASGGLESVLGRPMTTISGSVPAPGSFPSGCPFRDRCPHAIGACTDDPHVTQLEDERLFTCWNPVPSMGRELNAAAR